MTTHLEAVAHDPSAFDPARLAEHPDPYPVLRAAQAHGPVVLSRMGPSMRARL